jgi:hypothetical protein
MDEDKPSEGKETSENENPFGKKDDFFIGTGINEDDLFSLSTKDNKDNLLEHMGQFEFEEENKTDVDHFEERRKNSKEE